MSTPRPVDPQPAGPQPDDPDGRHEPGPRTAELPPHLRARYGLDRSNRGPILLAVLLVAAFVTVLGWAALRVADPAVTSKVLAWSILADDHVRVTFEVRRSADQPVTCVVRAQDETRLDVGYATVTLPSGTTYVQPTYQLRTNARATIVEVLGCAPGDAPDRVPPPQFPPGVAAPEQPWTPA